MRFEFEKWPGGDSPGLRPRRAAGPAHHRVDSGREHLRREGAAGALGSPRSPGRRDVRDAPAGEAEGGGAGEAGADAR